MRCKATSKQHGGQCKRKPIPGGAVCFWHGGAAPQVKLKAQERLAAYQDRAIDHLFELAEQKEYPSTRYAAVRDVLDRSMGKPIEQQQIEHKGAIRLIHELGE
jgi:hypothetical protein